MWTAMAERYGLWGCPPGTLNDFLREVLRACAGVLTRCLDDMPPESMLWIDFEALCSNPRQTMQEILRFLGPYPSVDEQTVAARLDQALRRVPVHHGSRASLPDDVGALELERLRAAARRRFRGGA
jgi:hypothetical protein